LSSCSQPRRPASRTISKRTSTTSRPVHGTRTPAPFWPIDANGMLTGVHSGEPEK
jgi:hypothetical protein